MKKNVSTNVASGMSRRSALAVVAGATIALAGMGQALAQDAAANFPERPITFVVGFGAGGGNDLMGRYLASEMSTRLGQEVVVENRTGAGGNVGASSVARSKADGYTLFFGTNGTQSMNQFLYADMPYDPEKDFVSIADVARVANVFSANNNIPVSNMAELLDYVRANPGKVRFGSGGIGTMSHLGGELISTIAGAKMIHVPYQGAAQMTLDLVAGHIDVTFDNVNSAIPLIEAGQIRPLGVANLERWFALPDVPAIAETIPGFEATSWQVVVAPAGTDPAIVAKLNGVINDILANEEVQQRMNEMGLQPVGGTPEDVDNFINSERDKWEKIIVGAGLTPQ